MSIALPLPRKPFKWLAISLAVAALIHAPAHAISSARASLDNLSITLTDLTPGNPSDNSPSITFLGMSGGYGYAFTAYPSEYHEMGWDNMSGGLGSFSGILSTSQSGSQTISDTSFNNTLTGVGTTLVGTLKSEGFANGTLGAVGVDYSWFGSQAKWNMNTGLGNSFALAPYTSARFDATALVRGSVSQPYSQITNNHEDSQASLVFRVNSNNYEYENTAANNSQVYGAVFSHSESLSFIVENNTDTIAYGNFWAHVTASGGSYAAAVPEPEAYLMMLAGTAMVGAVTRRRRHHSVSR